MPPGTRSLVILFLNNPKINKYYTEYFAATLKVKTLQPPWLRQSKAVRENIEYMGKSGKNIKNYSGQESQGNPFLVNLRCLSFEIF